MTMHLPVSRPYLAYDRPYPPLAARPLAEDGAADILIAGGGMTGLSTAIHLARGGAKVVLLEADQFGRGALGASGGFLTDHVELDYTACAPERGRTMHALFSSGVQSLIAIIKKRELQCEFEENCEALYLARTTRGSQMIAREARGRHALGLAGDQLLEETRLRSIYAAPCFKCALRSQGNHALNPVLLGRELARSAIEMGAALYPHTGLRSFAARSKTALTTTGASLRYGTLVIAAGSGTLALLPHAELHRLSLPLISHLMLTEPLSEHALAELFPSGRLFQLWDTKAFFNYSRCTPRREILFGGADYFLPLARALHEGIGKRDRRTALLRRQFLTFFPTLHASAITHFWRALIPASADYCPALGEVERDVWAAVFAPGLGPAFQIGALLADLLLQRAVDPPCLEICRWDRRLTLQQQILQKLSRLSFGCSLANAFLNWRDRLYC